MGVLNVTPDSFSDGGQWFDHEAAIAHGVEMIAEGADMVDVGGESTRPGAGPVDEEEEQRRVLPVIEALVAAASGNVRVSIDTRKARGGRGRGRRRGHHHQRRVRVSVAGGGRQPAPAGWPCTCSANPGPCRPHAGYDDVVAEVRGLPASAGRPGRGRRGGRGVDRPRDRVRQDGAAQPAPAAPPRQLVATGRPVVIGTSRKTFLGRLAPAAGGTAPAPVETGSRASVATAVWAITQGAAMVRVHDVASTDGRRPSPESPHETA